MSDKAMTNESKPTDAVERAKACKQRAYDLYQENTEHHPENDVWDDMVEFAAAEVAAYRERLRAKVAAMLYPTIDSDEQDRYNDVLVDVLELIGEMK